MRSRALLGLKAGQCVGCTRSSWPPASENGSLCSLEAPCNPSASVFPSVEGETSSSFWLLSNYHLSHSEDTGGKTEERKKKQETNRTCLCQYRHRWHQTTVMLLWAPVSYFLPQGESGWWDWLAAAGWPRDSSTNLCQMGSLETAEFSPLNEDVPEKTILQVMLGTSARREQSQHLFLPGKSKEVNTHPEITEILREY